MAVELAPLPLLQAYLSAHYFVSEADAGLQLIPGRQAPMPAPAPDRRHALLSACNPHSVPTSPAANAAATDRLRARLRQLGQEQHPAEGAAADGSWREPSLWLPAIALSTLDDLAGEFGQNACLVVAEDGIVRLRLYRPEWRAGTPPDARLEWPP